MLWVIFRVFDTAHLKKQSFFTPFHPTPLASWKMPRADVLFALLTKKLKEGKFYFFQRFKDNLNYLIIRIKRSRLLELCCIFRDKGNDSDDNSDTANNNGDNELPSLESVFSDGSEASLKNRGNNLSTSRLTIPSFQGDPTIFYKGIFLKQTPHIKN